MNFRLLILTAILFFISCAKDPAPGDSKQRIYLEDALTGQPASNISWYISNDGNTIKQGISDDSGFCHIPAWEFGYEIEFYSNRYKYYSSTQYSSDIKLKPYRKFVLEIDGTKAKERLLVWGSMDPTGFDLKPGELTRMNIEQSVPDTVFIRVAYGKDLLDTIYYQKWFDKPDIVRITLP